MAHSANYRYARDGAETSISHFPVETQHKCDGDLVVFGLQHEGRWDQALCRYDRSRPHEVLV